MKITLTNDDGSTVDFEQVVPAPVEVDVTDAPAAEDGAPEAPATAQ